MKANLLAMVTAALLGLFLTFAPPAFAQESDQETGMKGQITPTVRYVAVNGDEEKFREDWWMEDELTGGVEQFTYRQMLGDDLSFYAEGRAIFLENNYEVLMRLDKRDWGYVRLGYSEYRKWFDGTGGFFRPFSVQSFDLDKDLELDIGNVFIEAVLERPGLPRVLVGYEHDFKDGEKSLLEWGSVREGGVTRKIFPSFKDIDERLDIFKVEVDHDIGKFHLSDQFRYEHFSTDTARFDQSRNLDTGAARSVSVFESYKHDAFFNTFHTDSHLSEKVYVSLGYFLTNLEGDAAFRLRTNPFELEPFDRNWASRDIDVSEKAHVVNLNTMLGPFKDLSFYGGIEGEKLEVEGDTDAIAGIGQANPTNVLNVSDKDKWGLEEAFGARYAGIPRTILYAEGKWTQQDIDLFERQLEDGEVEVLRDTDTWVTRQRYSIGFNSSPLRRVTVSGRYRRTIASNDYDHLRDNALDDYPAFITDQDFTMDEVSAKLSLWPASWIQTSLQYQLLTMDIDTRTLTEPPATVQSGDYTANVYSTNITLTPMARLYLMGIFSYSDVRSDAFDNGSPSVLTYEGDVFTAVGSAVYAFDQKTKIDLQYLYSFSDNFRDNSANGLPLGLDNDRQGFLSTLTRRINKNLEARLRYGFYRYNEDSNGGVDDYDAHLVSVACTYNF